MEICQLGRILVTQISLGPSIFILVDHSNHAIAGENVRTKGAVSRVSCTSSVILARARTLAHVRAFSEAREQRVEARSIMHYRLVADTW